MTSFHSAPDWPQVRREAEQRAAAVPAGSQAWWPGQIGLVKSHSAIGAGVRIMQYTISLDHLRLAGWVHVITGLEHGQIGEAEPGGYRVVDMHYAPADVWWVPADHLPHGVPTPEQCATICSVARQMGDERVPYSLLDYEAIALRKAHIPAPGLREFIKDSGHQICSQSADYQHHAAGYQLFADERWEGYVPPVDMAVLFRAPPP